MNELVLELEGIMEIGRPMCPCLLETFHIAHSVKPLSLWQTWTDGYPIESDLAQLLK